MHTLLSHIGRIILNPLYQELSCNHCGSCFPQTSWQGRQSLSNTYQYSFRVRIFSTHLSQVISPSSGHDYSAMLFFQTPSFQQNFSIKNIRLISLYEQYYLMYGPTVVQVSPVTELTLLEKPVTFNRASLRRHRPTRAESPSPSVSG